MLRISLLVLFAAGAAAQTIQLGRPMVDAHNCYPYEGQWGDRIDRALSAGFPVSIEQDLTWYVDPATGQGREVISHAEKAIGNEPDLRHYFFERVRPIVERALRENKRDTWPLIVLHFDFKSDAAPLLQSVWKLLEEYEPWLTTAQKTGNPADLTPFDVKPILAITEDSVLQEDAFYRQVPVGQRLLVFGSAHMNRKGTVAMAPSALLTEKPTTYRRWWNNSWAVVEKGGQAKAGKWTAADMKRLKRLVDYAHDAGFLIRFYTLDGFTAAENRGWDQNYNFGSRKAVTARWKAAMEAGVDFIATDQYEGLADVMESRAAMGTSRPGGGK
ncbi:MAG TPA: hypothetical protein VN519_07195 [Bryobacteraceae bacterium]|nr:hypothetical protein [Bryobacteraceae bacterium]